MQRRTEEETAVLQEVGVIRLSQPRVGGRKLQKSINRRMGRDRLFALLRREGLLVRRRGRGQRTTYAGLNRFPNQIRNRPPQELAEVLVSDITYLRDQQGFSYLSLVTHARSRKIVGYSLRKDLSSQGPLEALEMAMGELGPRAGLIHHSDRGFQYGSRGFVALAQRNNITLSMTEEDHVYENALAERVNGILKEEFLIGDTGLPHSILLKKVIASIRIYNNERLHTSLGYKTPSEVFN